MKKKESILKRADEIIHNRSEEKERKYGPFSEDMYAALVALKLSRHSYNYREDNLLDCVAYLGGLDNYIKEKKK